MMNKKIISTFLSLVATLAVNAQTNQLPETNGEGMIESYLYIVIIVIAIILIGFFLLLLGMERRLRKLENNASPKISNT